MSNTKTLTIASANGVTSIIYFSLVSDGSQETNTVIYNSATVTGDLGIPDPKTCHLVSVQAATNSAAGLVKLNWDATTPVLALPLINGTGGTTDFKFKYFGGLPNTAGATGKTGNITLTTTGLASGESLSIVLEVRAN